MTDKGNLTSENLEKTSMEPDSTEDAKDKKNPENFKRKENFEEISMGGADFEAEQQRVLHELHKQKDTIKALLDEMQRAKKERLTYNIKSIFAQKK